MANEAGEFPVGYDFAAKNEPPEIILQNTIVYFCVYAFENAGEVLDQLCAIEADFAEWPEND
jgi:hypothetical protein